MKILRRSFRLIYLSYILLKHGLDKVVLETHLFRPLRFLFWLSPAHWQIQKQHPPGERIRQTLEELGPIFIKFGQQLSLRSDIFPEDIIKELAKLQDQVPPFPGNIAKKIIEDSLNASIESHFQSFDLTPLASASVAQVHSATLLTGETVVIKVLRPHIHALMKRDIKLLKTVASLAQNYSKIARKFKPLEIVAEFEKTLTDELDLVREAANASQLRRNFARSPLLYIPKIYWPLTRHSVLVMEKIQGIPIAHMEQLKQQGFDLKQLSELLIEIFFTQVFRDCFFHADMHPGNILVAPQSQARPQYIMVDFGIIGILSASDQHYLAENILAFLNRDYRRVAELHAESGWIPKSTRMDDFEAAIRTVSEPILEQSLTEISFGQLLAKLFQTALRYHINIQPQLILLQKTLLNIEGLSRQLYPNIDLLKTAKPILEKWVKSQTGLPLLLRKLKLAGPIWLEKLPEIPNLISRVLTELAKNAGTEAPVDEKKWATQQKYAALSLKDVSIGVLLGFSFSILWIIYRRYLE